MRSNAIFHVSGVRISSVYPTSCDASMLIWRSKSNMVMMKYCEMLANISLLELTEAYLESGMRNIAVHTPLLQIVLLLQLIPILAMRGDICARLR
jgi:hypothetical protein